MCVINLKVCVLQMACMNGFMGNYIQQMVNKGVIISSMNHCVDYIGIRFPFKSYEVYALDQFLLCSTYLVEQNDCNGVDVLVLHLLNQ